METVSILIAVASLLSTYFLVKWYRDPLRKIPGPPSRFLFGNAAELRLDQLRQSLMKWSEEYGPISKFYLFTSPVVFINSAELAVEAMMKRGKDFAARPVQPRLTELGIFPQHSDKTFAISRKVLNFALKAYGPGMRHLEEVTASSLKDFLSEMKARDGKPIKTDACASGFAGSSMCLLLFGKKYHFQDPVVQQMTQVTLDIMHCISPYNWGAIFDFFPFLRNFKFIFPKIQKSLDAAKKDVDDFLQQQYEEALRSFDADNVKGILEHLVEMQKNGAEGYSTQMIKSTIAGLILGGVDSTAMIGSQMFLNLLHNPDVMRKIQAEIDQNFKPTHIIGYSDKDSLPYLEAFVLEVLRYGSLGPYLPPRAALRDSEVGGYKIPKGTLLVTNAFEIMHNPDVYKEPFKFKPERFLDGNGKLLPVGHPVRANILQFGLGKRRCPGELFGKSRVFTFMGNILKEFDIEAAEPVPDDNSLHYKITEVGSTEVEPVEIRFISRVK